MKYLEGIKSLRKKVILSRMEFANFLSVSFDTAKRWENDKFAPTIKMKRKLAPLFEKYGIGVVE